MEDLTIGLAFIAGFLSFISPCVLPLVPAYIGYMSGRMTRNVAMEVGSTTKVKTDSISARATMLAHGVAFVLGFTVVFVMIGLMTTAFVSVLGSSVNTLTDIIGRVGGIMIIFFGLHFMGVMPSFFKRLKTNPSLISTPLTSLVILFIGVITLGWGFKGLEFHPNIFVDNENIVFALPFIAGFVLWLIVGGSFTQPKAFWLKLINQIELLLYSDTRGQMKQSQNTGLSGSFLMGVVFSAGWTPCIGPLLGTILTISANTGDVSVAIPLLTAYSLGLGIPFLIAAILMEGAQSIIRRLQRHMRTIELVSGGLLVVVGILVASGQLTILSQNLNNTFADFSYRVEECGVGFFRGDVDGQYVGDCLNGTLHVIALNQSMYGNLGADTEEMKYLFTLEEAQNIDLEFSRVDLTAPPKVTLIDSTGVVLAESNTLTLIAEDGEPVQPNIEAGTMTLLEGNTYVSLTNIALDRGQYLIHIASPNLNESERFRLKVREAQPLSGIETGDSNEGETNNTSAVGDNVTSELATSGLSTIEDLAEISEPIEGLNVGNLAPDFTVTTLGGETFNLSELRGQVVLINFWGTWCGPCRREMPELQSVYETYADQNFTILALAVRDQSEAVAAFRDEYNLSFTLALDSGEIISEQYAIPGQPSTLILNPDGVIIFQHFSTITADMMIPVIEDALPEL